MQFLRGKKLTVQLVLIIVICTSLFAVTLGVSTSIIETYNAAMVKKSILLSEKSFASMKLELLQRVENVGNSVIKLCDALSKHHMLEEKGNKLLDLQDTFNSYVSMYFDFNNVERMYIRSIALYSRQGISVVYGEVGGRIEDPFGSTYYRTALAQPTRLCWVCYDDASRTANAAKLIYDEQTGMSKGLLVVKVDMKFFFNPYTQYALLANGTNLVVKHSGLTIASNQDWFQINILKISIQNGPETERDNFQSTATIIYFRQSIRKTTRKA